ncbi:MAG: T9SS type A sorting domain-containing protein [Bacteroidetes bacterium]|nr:T9SS type A sorting domain-containing protein [Bacteroidota bacterium]
MKQTIIISLFSLFFCVRVFAQNSTPEYYFKFMINDQSELDTITKLISIDNVKGLEVFAYAMPDEMDDFKKLEYKIEFLQKDIPKSIIMATTIGEMENFDRYPTYEVYREMMKNFESSYPSLCKLDSIGETANGRQLYVLKISDNVSSEEAEPEFFYTSTMHGDEVTGFILMLRLADSLLTTYGSAAQITELVNEVEIYINPNANPDGTYYGGNQTVQDAIRSNGVKDINRDFPDPRIGANSPYQPETQAMMDFADAHNFVMSANFHGGVEVMNYPWDTWSLSSNRHADTDWFEQICTDYVTTARTVNTNYMSSLYADGVTHGASWYQIGGGRQDYMNYWHQCREVTIEVSTTKLLGVENLNNYWNYNKQSLLNYINECLYGISGIVKNTSNDPLDAMVEIINHDEEDDSSMVFTDPNHGNYHRLIEKGTYNIVASADGYVNDTIYNVDVNWKNITRVNITLRTPQELTDSIALKVESDIINDTLFFDETNTHNIVIYNDSNAVSTSYEIKIKNAATNYWVSLDKSSGNLYGTQNDTVKATINTIDLTAGNYSANIILTSADAETDTVTINLFVKDSISTYIEPQEITDTLWSGNSAEYEIYLKNNGLLSFNYTLQIDDAESNNWISLNKNSGNLALTETDTVTASVETNEIGFGNFDCNLIIEKENSTNDTIVFAIFVKDTTSAVITPKSIRDTIEESSNKSYNIYIENTGNRLLEYTVELDFPTKSDTWITVNKSSGIIAIQEIDSILIHIDSTSIVTGNYSCMLRIIENDEDQTEVPVDIHVVQVQSIHSGMPLVFNAYPNPFHDELLIEFDKIEQSPTMISLFSINGELLVQKPLKTFEAGNSIIIGSSELNSLPKGTYILKISTPDIYISKKLIKQ